MALYSGAAKLLLPESRSQARIRPTQFIIHSLSAPWTVRRTYEFWRDSTSLESHFGIDYTGAVAQYIDTGVRADANASANGRAISVETASQVGSKDSWNDRQLDALAKLMAWAHKTHGIPLRKCPSASGSGFGVHSMFREWSGGGTYCPGDRRRAQFPALLVRAARYANGGTSSTKEPTVESTRNDGRVELNHLKYGKKDWCVEELQRALIKRGYSIPAGATHYYGDQTKAAVAKFQRAQGWTGEDADGIPGLATITKLGLKEYDSDDPAPKATKKVSSPVPGHGVTYPYGVRNSRYAAGFHTGQDHAAPTGAKVVAVRSGTIAWSNGNGGAYGNWIGLNADNGRTYVYCHLSSRSVSAGQKVKAGAQIGRVGATGNVTGPHLHFEDRPRGGGYGQVRKPIW